jgi:ABC-2 type transport system ATP-binding protein
VSDISGPRTAPVGSTHDTVTTLAVETSGLRKVRRSWLARSQVVIHDVDLQVPTGTVHALLGPEGAGKTTLLRMLLGLERPSRGTVRILGAPARRGPRAPRVALGRVSAVLGEPGFLPHLSGHRNLLLLARSAGIGDAQVAAALSRVGLTRRERSRYRTYPADARRRLALAAALMSSPDLLVLDEPTRGLEAPAARAVRDLVHDLARSGTTVLLSSHDVGEVQRLCDTVSVLVEGRLVAQGRASDLVGEHAFGALRVRVSDPMAATTALEQAGFRVRPDGEVLHVEDVVRPDDVTRTLAAREIWARELTPTRVDLETVVARVAWDRTLRVGGARRATAARGLLGRRR